MADSPLMAALKYTIEDAIQLKEKRVGQATTRDESSITPYVQGYRGKDPVVRFVTALQDRDQALVGVKIAAIGFGCDIVALVIDTWSARTKENPVTGQEWKQGDMQDLVENHQGLEKGWIGEGLTIHIINRAGDMAGTVKHYVIEEKDGSFTLTWQTDKDPSLDMDTENSGEWEGVIPQTMLKMMEFPTIDVIATKLGVMIDDFGLTPEQARAHIDCAAVRQLMNNEVWSGVIMLMAGPEEKDRVQILRDSLSKYALMDNLNEILKEDK